MTVTHAQAGTHATDAPRMGSMTDRVPGRDAQLEQPAEQLEKCPHTGGDDFVSLHDMAIAGFDLDKIGYREFTSRKQGLGGWSGSQINIPACDLLGIHLMTRIKFGFRLLDSSIVMRGEDRGIESISEARCLRLMYAYCLGMLDDLDTNNFANRNGLTKLHIAEIFCEIRDTDGNLKQEWK